MLHPTSPALTNEHIAVAQVCLRCWAKYLDALGHASSELETASKALSALEAITVESRSEELSIAYNGRDIAIEDIENILRCLNNVVQYHFGDAVPQYLEEVRRFFFAVLCQQKDFVALMRLEDDSDVARRAVVEREKSRKVS
jgi:hypothetical protein